MKIDKNIPIPTRPLLIDYAALEIGDSFLSDKMTAANQAMQWAKYHGNNRVFISRREGEKYRVWRTK